MSETTRPVSVSRALVVAGPVVTHDSSGARPMAGFVTQVIACARGVPAFRRARREAPGTALLAYGPRRPGAVRQLDVNF